MGMTRIPSAPNDFNWSIFSQKSFSFTTECSEDQPVRVSGMIVGLFIPGITSVIPGMKSPTIMPLTRTGWSSLHSVVNENDFWEKIDQLKSFGAEGILVIPIEKMIA